MMLIGTELRRIVGRRGSFFGVLAVALVIAALGFYAIGDAAQSPPLWINLLGTPLIFGATIVGALEGSYDLSQGTMRYLVLTGVPRWRLVAIRAPALFAAITLLCVPAMLVAAFAMLGDGQAGSDVAHTLANVWTLSVCWGIVAMAVGTLLQSNGAGIAVALVFYFAASIITLVVRSQISERAGDYLLPNVISVVARYGDAPPLDTPDPTALAFPNALVALAVWLVVVLGLAALRVKRDEY
ncbi:MAG: hypothetical protein QM679_12105 [Patulibacter sp.]